MANIFIVLLGILFGVVPTFYVIYEATITIAKKVYRKVKFGTSLYD